MGDKDPKGEATERFEKASEIAVEIDPSLAEDVEAISEGIENAPTSAELVDEVTGEGIKGMLKSIWDSDIGKTLAIAAGAGTLIVGGYFAIKKLATKVSDKVRSFLGLQTSAHKKLDESGDAFEIGLLKLVLGGAGLVAAPLVYEMLRGRFGSDEFWDVLKEEGVDGAGLWLLGQARDGYVNLASELWGPIAAAMGLKKGKDMAKDALEKGKDKAKGKVKGVADEVGSGRDRLATGPGDDDEWVTNEAFVDEDESLWEEEESLWEEEDKPKKKKKKKKEEEDGGGEKDEEPSEDEEGSEDSGEESEEKDETGEVSEEDKEKYLDDVDTEGWSIDEIDEYIAYHKETDDLIASKELSLEQAAIYKIARGHKYWEDRNWIGDLNWGATEVIEQIEAGKEISPLKITAFLAAYGMNEAYKAGQTVLVSPLTLGIPTIWRLTSAELSWIHSLGEVALDQITGEDDEQTTGKLLGLGKDYLAAGLTMYMTCSIADATLARQGIREAFKKNLHLLVTHPWFYGKAVINIYNHRTGAMLGYLKVDEGVVRLYEADGRKMWDMFKISGKRFFEIFGKNRGKEMKVDAKVKAEIDELRTFLGEMEDADDKQHWDDAKRESYLKRMDSDMKEKIKNYDNLSPGKTRRTLKAEIRRLYQRRIRLTNAWLLSGNVTPDVLEAKNLHIDTDVLKKFGFWSVPRKLPKKAGVIQAATVSVTPSKSTDKSGSKDKSKSKPTSTPDTGKVKPASVAEFDKWKIDYQADHLREIDAEVKALYAEMEAKKSPFQGKNKATVRKQLQTIEIEYTNKIKALYEPRVKLTNSMKPADVKSHGVELDEKILTDLDLKDEALPGRSKSGAVDVGKTNFDIDVKTRTKTRI